MKLFLALFTLLLVVGCTTPPSPPNTLTYPAPNDAYPGPGAVRPSITRTPLPPPNPAIGTVTGRFLQKTTGAPLHGEMVYMGELTPITPGPQYLISVDQQNAPHTAIDSDGYFALTGLKPGTFAIVVWTPVKSMVVGDPGKADKELDVTVNGGKITDIGEIEIDF